MAITPVKSTAIPNACPPLMVTDPGKIKAATAIGVSEKSPKYTPPAMDDRAMNIARCTAQNNSVQFVDSVAKVWAAANEPVAGPVPLDGLDKIAVKLAKLRSDTYKVFLAELLGRPGKSADDNDGIFEDDPDEIPF